MKKIIPLLFFIALITPSLLQGVANHTPKIAVGVSSIYNLPGLEVPNIKVYPNPATEYIELSENSKVSKIVIFNLVGREMKRFDAYNGQKYYVGDLDRGLYLVQLLDKNNQTVTTQRVSKR